MLKERWKKHNGSVPTISHAQLVNRGFAYLKAYHACSVVFKERKASVSEEPDVMGFKGRFSTLIECKSSRSDFAADRKKFFRQRPERGMGYNRYIMAPVGLLTPSEMPEGWGLLEVYDKERGFRRIRLSKESVGFSERNEGAEISYLVSSIRRIQISMAVFIEAPIEAEVSSGEGEVVE